MSEETRQKDIQTVKRGEIEIRIIRGKCIGAATCTVYAPNTFDLDNESIAVIKEGDWDKLEKIIAAAESCPVYAIEVYKSGEKVYPEF